MNTVRRSIRYWTSHLTASVPAPYNPHRYAEPSTSKAFPPACRSPFVRISAFRNDTLMQQAAIEFAPATTSGNARRRQPRPEPGTGFVSG
jgi:hypothetical protein